MPRTTSVSDEETEELIEEMLSFETEDAEAEHETTPRRRSSHHHHKSAAAAADHNAYAYNNIAPKLWTTECDTLYTWCRRLNTLCVLIYSASAILSLCLCLLLRITTHRTLVLQHFTDGSAASMSFAPSWSVAPVWLVPPVFFVSTLSHLLLHCMRKKTWKERWLVEQRNPLRWWDMSLTTPLLMLSAAIFCGLTTYTELLLLVTNHWAASVASTWLMRTVNPLKPPHQRTLWMPLVLAYVITLCCWTSVGMPVMSAPTATPAAVLGLYWSAVPWALLLLPAAAAYPYRGPRSLAQYVKSECVVMVVHLLFKTLVAWQIVGSSITA
jgi:hypothetical protein